MKRLLGSLLLVGIIDGLGLVSLAAEPVVIGSDRELFLDHHVIEGSDHCRAGGPRPRPRAAHHGHDARYGAPHPGGTIALLIGP